ncbi:MAG: nuclear export factor [Blastococcus sp.]|nr:nuclear export factor [Blastococcus sp.]
MSLPRTLARSLTVLTAGIAVLATSVGVAAAHVSVSSQDASPGGFGKVTFRVPNESDTASTVAIRIQIPQEAAMASLSTEPLPGWTVTRTTADLSQPVESGGREITSYVSVVEFQAADGGGIGPGEFQEFALSGGPFPDVGQVVFPVVQSYSDGTEAAWIEPTVDGQPEPELPAPTLDLAADGTASAPATATATGAAPTAAAAVGEHSHGEVIARDPSGLALLFSILALLMGATGAFLGWRAHRRTVSS